jgi:LPXTG-motif cell wall-anchored protein
VRLSFQVTRVLRLSSGDGTAFALRAPESPDRPDPHREITVDTNTLLIIIVLVLLLGGGGIFYRGRR